MNTNNISIFIGDQPFYIGIENHSESIVRQRLQVFRESIDNTASKVFQTLSIYRLFGSVSSRVLVVLKNILVEN